MASSIAKMPMLNWAALQTRNSKPLLSLSFKTFCSSSQSSSAPKQRKLILYSRPGCCLCDGLKEKIHAAFSLAPTPLSLQDVNLEIRDISTNAEWERAYQYEIPVLAKICPDGTEERLPRFSPRVGVELIHKKLAEALDQ